jgi:hypothetical protein
MASTLGDPPQLTDSDVDALAWQFLKSPYADNNTYVDWALDRRLDGFLRRRGLVGIAEDGDAYDLILNRVMGYIGATAHPGLNSQTGRGGPQVVKSSSESLRTTDDHR